jgi:hypothetical protein
MTPRVIRFMVVCVLLLAGRSRALVNPALQPQHLYAQYRLVLGMQVASVDSKSLTITLTVEQVVKGEFEPKTVTLQAANQEQLEPVLSIEPGQRIVAFISQQSRGGQGRILYYIGGGKWHIGSFDPQQPQSWTLVSDADAGKDAGSADIMFGVFNGSVDRLCELVQDEAAGRGYFPAQPFTRFSAAVVATLNEPIRGVGIHDVNADGRLDLIATSAAGVRVLLQDEKAAWTDATQRLGLAGVTAVSCALADVDGDGDADLLLDGRLYRMDGDGWKATDLLPAMENVLSAAFVELAGDARPEIVVSIRDGGLRAFTFAPRAANAPACKEVTAELQLDQAENGGGASGYFETIDWNQDDKLDLVHLAGPGRILLRTESGFEAIPLSEGEDSQWRTAAAGPILGPERPAALLAGPESKVLIAAEPPPFADVTRYGNEIQDEAPGLLMAIAEDLNADGTIDLFGASEADGSPAMFLMNRGYGSFMLEEKYAGGKIIPPQVYNQSAWGLAAGDVTGDGAADLLVGGLDGKLRLLTNRTLEDRPEAAQLSSLQAQRKQIETRLLTVRVRGPGAFGAKVLLRDENGRLVQSRRIGGNVGIGCAAPQQLTFAAREPGQHTLEVDLAGTVQRVVVNLGSDQPRHQIVSLPPPQ